MTDSHPTPRNLHACAGTLPLVGEALGPWVRNGSRIVYANAWITVREDSVITPSGTDGIYGVVEASPAIGIVPIDGDGQVYLVGQYRYPIERWSWEIPEGGAKAGETPSQGARRELAEETGLTAFEWISLGTMATSNCFVDEIAHLFLAEDLVVGEPHPDPTEALEVRRLGFEDAMAMVRSGEIQDAMTIVALYRAAEALEARRQGR